MRGQVVSCVQIWQKIETFGFPQISGGRFITDRPVLLRLIWTSLGPIILTILYNDHLIKIFKDFKTPIPVFN